MPRGDNPHPERGIYCVGGYKPIGTDVHGTAGNYVAGCRCTRCRAAQARAHRTQHSRTVGIHPNKYRARKFIDPLRVARWYSPKVGGPWLLFLAMRKKGAYDEPKNVATHLVPDIWS